MGVARRLLEIVNRPLAALNLRLDTLTKQQREAARLNALDRSGHFDRPVFPLPGGFTDADCGWIMEALRSRARELASLEQRAEHFCYLNDYFSSPDAEVYYSIICSTRPGRIVEVGSGHSTYVARQALLDQGVQAELIAIDPKPRREIDALVDRHFAEPVESIGQGLFEELRAGDILFIDSSHELRVGSDVTHLYGRVLPILAAGVILHIHDIFLPWEYPRHWLLNDAYGLGWNEQHLVQALLRNGSRYQVLWPGHYLQQTNADFGTWFPKDYRGTAQSLWLRVR